MAHNGALDSLFDQSIEWLMQSLVLEDVSTRRALASSRFVCPVAKLVVENLEEQAKVFKQTWISLDASFSFSLTDFSISKSSEYEKYCKYAESKHIEWIEQDYPAIVCKERKEYKQQKMMYCLSSVSFLNVLPDPPSSDRESLGTYSKIVYAKTIEPPQPVLQTA